VGTAGRSCVSAAEVSSVPAGRARTTERISSEPHAPRSSLADGGRMSVDGPELRPVAGGSGSPLLLPRTYTGRARSRQTTSVADPCPPGVRGWLGSVPAPPWIEARLTPQGCVPTLTGRATPSSWSPFLRVGARTLRTEQCAKSQCVSPSREGRGSPRPERDGRTQQHRKAEPGVLPGEADFPTTNPNPALVAGPTVLLRRV
jgi:hypothetical protein